jgi:hypothetical protein
VRGESSSAQATVLRMPGMISGTRAAAPANALAGVLVRLTNQARPKPTQVHTAAVAVAYTDEFTTSRPNPAEVNVRM